MTFNRVNHGTLLEKFEACGARRIVLQLLKSFLRNNKQNEQIDGKISEVRDLYVGVPEESVWALYCSSYL